jgi:hypothetical protein
MDELKAIITEEFNAIPQEMVVKACRSVLDRMAFCRHLEAEPRQFTSERQENMGGGDGP